MALPFFFSSWQETGGWFGVFPFWTFFSALSFSFLHPLLLFFLVLFFLRGRLVSFFFARRGPGGWVSSALSAFFSWPSFSQRPSTSPLWPRLCPPFFFHNVRQPLFFSLFFLSGEHLGDAQSGPRALRKGGSGFSRFFFSFEAASCLGRRMRALFLFPWPGWRGGSSFPLDLLSRSSISTVPFFFGNFLFSFPSAGTPFSRMSWYRGYLSAQALAKLFFPPLGLAAGASFFTFCHRFFSPFFVSP